MSKTSNNDVKLFMHDKLNAKVSFSQRLERSNSWDLLLKCKRKIFRPICAFDRWNTIRIKMVGPQSEWNWAQVLVNTGGEGRRGEEKRREMSQNWLYFKEICSAKAIKDDLTAGVMRCNPLTLLSRTGTTGSFVTLNTRNKPETINGLNEWKRTPKAARGKGLLNDYWLGSWGLSMTWYPRRFSLRIKGLTCCCSHWYPILLLQIPCVTSSKLTGFFPRTMNCLTSGL